MITALTHDPLERIYSTCKKAPQITTPCAHRGNEIRRVECKTCSGTIRIKVFKCAIHGECVISQAIDGIKRCSSCADYEPKS